MDKSGDSVMKAMASVCSIAAAPVVFHGDGEMRRDEVVGSHC